jgi:hypothetical protein
MFYQVTGMSAPQNKNPVDTRPRLGGAPEKKKTKNRPGKRDPKSWPGRLYQNRRFNPAVKAGRRRR